MTGEEELVDACELVVVARVERPDQAFRNDAGA
jgi:hypothetical protein